MSKPAHWRIVGVLLGVCLLSLALGILPVVAKQPTPSPTLEEDELLRYLQLCRFAKMQQTSELCQRLSQPRAANSPTAKVRPTGYIKGLYITYYGLGSPTHRAHVQDLLETTELNAIVMDIKGDRGYIPYTSTVQLAVDIGANPHPMIEDWAAWMQWFHDRNIYTIARIVTFKDEPLASAQPEWAVLDAGTEAIWRDRENLGWTDPMREEVWDYNIALAVEAAQKGFDEIQFDYVRFPSDGAIKQAMFANENSQENRIAAIKGFLAKAREALAPYRVKLAVDVFGYTTWRQDDMGIGQQIEAMAPYRMIS
jgi:hypothetical protein